MRPINPINNRGSIQLKFSYGGQRYSLTPIPGGRFDDARDLATARAIATQIQNDVLARNFDQTLNRYRLTALIIPSEPPAGVTLQSSGASALQPCYLLDLWDRWIETLLLSEDTKAGHYLMIRLMLLRLRPKSLDTDWLLKAKLAPSTINKRMSYLRSCFRWAVDEGLVDVNPWLRIKPMPTARKDIRPFTKQETEAVINGFRQLYPHWVPFVRFLFLTGVRLSEAIGLRQSAIGWESQTVTIRESMSKDRAGNGYTRIRKQTKSGTVRLLTMNSDLESLLSVYRGHDDADSLIFLTPSGCVIDSGNFRTLWVEVLRHTGVPYRRIHDIRHSFASHAIQQGIPITGVSYLLGHRDTTMVVRTYGHLIDRPKLPSIV